VFVGPTHENKRYAQFTIRPAAQARMSPGAHILAVEQSMLMETHPAGMLPFAGQRFGRIGS
jgi:hypothetical protein